VNYCREVQFYLQAFKIAVKRGFLDKKFELCKDLFHFDAYYPFFAALGQCFLFIALYNILINLHRSNSFMPIL